MVISGTMKNTILILIGSLIAMAVHAETVYLSGVTQTRYEHWNSDGSIIWGEAGGTPPIELWDARGISSVTLDPFIVVYDANGHILPDQGVSFIIEIRGSWLSEFYGGQNTPFTLAVETWINTDHPDQRQEAPSPVQLGAGLMGDTGPPSSNGYRELHPEEQTWQFGFNVLSYEAIPEPSTWVLILGSLGAWVFYRLRQRRSPA